MKSGVPLESGDLALQKLKAPPVIHGHVSFGSLDDQVLTPVTVKPPLAWFVAFAITSTAMLLGMALIGYTIATGIGVWGNNIPVAWAFDIINFVFWVGIGHAGTLISAILLLFRARWRNAISRFSEAMTIFAVICATLFPLIHVGRPWLCFLADALSQPARDLAEFPFSSDLGCVRRQHLLPRLPAFLVPGTRSGPGFAARSNGKQDSEIRLLHSVPRMARRCIALAALRKGLPDHRRTCHGTGSFGPQRRVLRFRRFARARLAHDDFPALFRDGRNFRRIRHGCHGSGRRPDNHASGASHHRISSGGDEQGHPHLLLPDGLCLPARRVSPPGTA